MWREELRKNSEFQMGFGPTTFRTLALTSELLGTLVMNRGLSMICDALMPNRGRRGENTEEPE